MFQSLNLEVEKAKAIEKARQEKGALANTQIQRATYLERHPSRGRI